MGFLIDMIAVEQGDAFIISIENSGLNVNILIDGGSPSDGQRVVNFVNRWFGGSLHMVIGTHVDNDHIGGLPEVVRQCSVNFVYVNMPPGLPELRKLLDTRLAETLFPSEELTVITESIDSAATLQDALAHAGKVFEPITAGMWATFGDVTLRVLSPTPERLTAAWDFLKKEEDPVTESLRSLAKEFKIEVAPPTSPMNDSSVVLELIYRNSPYALFTGDAGADVIRAATMGKSYPFLKVSHHGSKTGLDEALAKQIRPTRAYISVGDNTYGHPSEEVLKMLKTSGAKTFCSHKTDSCLPGCPAEGFGDLCHPKDHPGHDWRIVDPAKCANNR